MTKELTCSCLPMLCAYMEQDNSAKQLKELHGSNCNLFLRFDHSLLLPFLCCRLKKLSCVFAPPNCNVWLFITVITQISQNRQHNHIVSYLKLHFFAEKSCPCHIHTASLLSPCCIWALWVHSDLSMVVLETLYGLDMGKWILRASLQCF